MAIAAVFTTGKLHEQCTNVMVRDNLRQMVCSAGQNQSLTLVLATHYDQTAAVSNPVALIGAAISRVRLR